MAYSRVNRAAAILHLQSMYRVNASQRRAVFSVRPRQKTFPRVTDLDAQLIRIKTLIQRTGAAGRARLRLRVKGDSTSHE
jgi:hypothetical protein